MLTDCFLPSRVVVEENSEPSQHDRVKERDACEGGEMMDDDDVAQELRDDSSLRDDAEKGVPSATNNSILGDFSLFRDFFLAAFSDGCYKVTCCGSEGLFPGSGNISQRRAREISNTDSFENTSDRCDAQLIHSADLNISQSGSYEGIVVGPQRKRPLAVAVGFKYAEDMNGRPIVITTGSRRIPPINRIGSRLSHPSSPASKSVETKKIDGASNVLFPIDHGPEI